MRFEEIKYKVNAKAFNFTCKITTFSRNNLTIGKKIFKIEAELFIIKLKI